MHEISHSRYTRNYHGSNATSKSKLYRRFVSFDPKQMNFQTLLLSLTHTVSFSLLSFPFILHAFTHFLNEGENFSRKRMCWQFVCVWSKNFRISLNQPTTLFAILCSQIDSFCVVFSSSSFQHFPPSVLDVKCMCECVCASSFIR